MKQLLPKLLNRSYSLLFILSFLLSSLGWGQIVPGNNIIDCSGAAVNFFDPGGSGGSTGITTNYTISGNYSNEAWVVYTICPDEPNQYVTVTFSNVYLDAPYDHIMVLNGGGSDDDIIDDFYNLATINNGPTITSSNSDGCLTFIFQSDNIYVSGGWSATVDCTSSAGTNTTICQYQDCQSGCGTPICGTGNYTWIGDNSTNVEELTGNGTQGCLSFGEECNTWFYINPESTGTIMFNMISNGGGDQDWAVWQATGSTLQCPIVTGDAPIRCNFASMNTSMSTPGTGVWGPWDASSSHHEADIVVTQALLDANVYYMVNVNTYNSGAASNCPQSDVTITFGGTALLSCDPPVPLPTDNISLFGIHQDKKNLINWSSQSPPGYFSFKLQRSRDGTNWEDIYVAEIVESSFGLKNYTFIDPDPYNYISYYRVLRMNIENETKQSEVISIKSIGERESWIGPIIPNPGDGLFGFSYSGNDFSESVDINVIDQYGRIAHHQQWYPSKLEPFMTIDIGEFQSGTYFIRFTQRDKIHYCRYIKL